MKVLDCTANSPALFERIGCGDPHGYSIRFCPSEKLQLVEDLWDDLAAAPDSVPVHDWQRRELARRKANLLKNPDSGLRWEDVKLRISAHRAC